MGTFEGPVAERVVEQMKEEGESKPLMAERVEELEDGNQEEEKGNEHEHESMTGHKAVKLW